MAESPMAREARLCMLVIDLAGFARATRGADSSRVIAFLDPFFARLGGAISEHGGRLVKYLGDGALAVFDADRAADAVRCAGALDTSVGDLALQHDFSLRICANVHVATIIEGHFGTPEDRRYDIIGNGVMHTFRMGAAPGVRVSEPVYRQLATSERSAWVKHRPPATYELTRAS